MSLIQEIQKAQLQARKAGAEQSIAAALYTTLLGEAVMVGKNAGNRETTDAEVIAVVQKFLKNNQETVKALSARGQDTSMYDKEQAILSALLPKQLSAQEMVQIAKENSITSMPDFMKFLKANYAGQYDGKTASEVAKTL